MKPYAKAYDIYQRMYTIGNCYKLSLSSTSYTDPTPKERRIREKTDLRENERESGNGPAIIGHTNCM